MSIEDPIQAAIVEYVRRVAPQCVIHSVPNGSFLAGDEKARAKQMARLKWTGLTEGAFDLVLFGPGGFAAVIEVKTAMGHLSPAQQTMRHRYVDLGTPHCIARSIDAVRAALEQWGIETREAKPI